MPDYCFRISHAYEAAQRIIAAWALRSDKLIVYEHVGGRTEKVHIHGLILGTSVDKKQLRNVAADTNSCPVSGQENLSFTTNDWDGDSHYMTYMSKGKHDPKYLKGYTDDEARVWKQKWVEPNPVFSFDKDDKMYDEFSQSMMDTNEIWIDTEGHESKKPQYYKLVHHAKDWVRKVHGGFHKVRNRNILKNMLIGYLDQYNVSIPKGENPSWKF